MIYFDNSATTPMHESVIETMMKVQKQFIGNPSSLHHLGTSANALLQKARVQIENLLNVAKDTVIFTSGGTESNNLAIMGTIYEKNCNHIITSAIEHPSVSNTMAHLAQRGYDITYLPVDQNGQISVSDLEAAITKNTCLVSLMWVNNEVGSILPIEEVSKVLEKYPIIHFHVDAVQALDELLMKGIPSRVDLLSLSAHKFHGPRGVGMLYKKTGKKIRAVLMGGGQENGLRSGTENTAGIVATARALREFVEESAQLKVLSHAFKAKLSKYEKVRMLSPENGAHHIVTFALPGVRGEVMVHALEQHHIYISTTSACSSRVKSEHHTLGAMKVPGEVSKCAVRVSFSKWNTLDEIEQFDRVFEKLYAQFLKIAK